MVLADKRTCPPSLCEFITLITYLFFPLTLCLSCLPSGQPVRAHPSPTYLVGLSTYVIKSFLLFHSTVAPIILLCSKVFCFTKIVYSSPLGLVTHFSLSPTLFTFLTCFSQLASLPACFLCCLCCSVVVRVSWTEGDSVRVGKPHTSLSTIPGHRQSRK